MIIPHHMVIYMSNTLLNYQIIFPLIKLNYGENSSETNKCYKESYNNYARGREEDDSKDDSLEESLFNQKGKPGKSLQKKIWYEESLKNLN